MINALTPDSIATSILLLREAYDGAIVVLEGSTDRKVYGKFFDPMHCQIIAAYNKDTVVQVIQILDSHVFNGAVGVVDADYWLIEDIQSPSQNLLITDTHDIETMMIKSDAFSHLMNEFGSEKKISKYEKRYGSDVRTSIIEATIPLGGLRFISKSNNLNLRFERLNFSKFMRIRGRLAIRIDDLISTVLDYSQRFDVNGTQISENIHSILAEGYDPFQICCGHDCISILALSLRRLFGSNNAIDVRPDRLELSLRLAYEFIHFKKTLLFSSLIAWQTSTSFLLFR